MNYIACDTIEYAKMHNNRAVKKTLTIPEWLNEAATRAGVNYSQVLQEALMRKLNISRQSLESLETGSLIFKIS